MFLQENVIYIYIYIYITQLRHRRIGRIFLNIILSNN